MMTRLILSLRQPRQLLTYINDSKGVVFLYTLIITLLTFLPNILLLNIQGVIDDARYQDFYVNFQTEMFSKNNRIQDGRLTLEEDVDFTYDIFRISNSDALSYHIQIVLMESGMSMQISTQEIAFISYDPALDVDFNDVSIQSVSIFTRYIESFIESVDFMTILYGFSMYISLVIDYILITLFLTLLMSFSIFKTSLHFKKRFKLGLYISTVYVVFNMMTILFQFELLQFFSLLITYFYYVNFYKQFKGGVV